MSQKPTKKQEAKQEKAKEIISESIMSHQKFLKNT